MARAVSSSFRQAVNAQRTMEGFWLLATVEHPDLPEPLRLNDSGRNLVSRGNIFLVCPLQITLGEDGPDRPMQAKAVLDNIDRYLISALRSTLTPPKITLELVKDSDPDTVEVTLTDFELRDITYDALTIQGTLSLEKLFQEPAIGWNFTPSYFPGLF